METWTKLLDQHRFDSAKFPRAIVILAGDGNTHFSQVVDHVADCSCPHCSQTKTDRMVEKWLTDAGLACYNDGMPTHDNGYTIDVMIGSLSKIFSIALTDADSGTLLNTQETLDALVDDMLTRSDNDFPQDPGVASELKRFVSSIRNARAPAVLTPGLPSRPGVNTAAKPEKYTMEELEIVLANLSVHKQCLHCPYAALKSHVPAGRKLTLALCNLGRVAAITSTLWCQRFVGHLRKAGPLIVRMIKNLRPASQVCDMCAVQDALWMLRCQDLLSQYSGNNQVGGKFDAVSLLIALVVHTQLRKIQGFDTFWFELERKWAFDVANHQVMLVAAYMGHYSN